MCWHACCRHTSRFLLCYILCGLPLLMWPLAGWGAPLLSVAIAFLVLGGWSVWGSVRVLLSRPSVRTSSGFVLGCQRVAAVLVQLSCGMYV